MSEWLPPSTLFGWTGGFPSMSRRLVVIPFQTDFKEEVKEIESPAADPDMPALVEDTDDEVPELKADPDSAEPITTDSEEKQEAEQNNNVPEDENDADEDDEDEDEDDDDEDDADDVDYPPGYFDVNDRVEMFRNALLNANLSVLEALTPEDLDLSYNSPCSCPGCDLVEHLSVWSCLLHRPIPTASLRFLLDHQKLCVEKVLQLVGPWMEQASTFSIAHVDLLLDFLLPCHLEQVRPETQLLFSALDADASWEQTDAWVSRLLVAGCDPFQTRDQMPSPWVIMIEQVRPRLLRQVAHLYPTQVDVNVKMIDAETSRGCTPLLRLLHECRYEKRPNRLTDVRDTVQFLIDHQADLTPVDRDGRNVTNYLWDYNWMDVLGAPPHRPSKREVGLKHLASVASRTALEIHHSLGCRAGRPEPTVKQGVFDGQDSVSPGMELAGPILLQDLLKCSLATSRGAKSAIVGVGPVHDPGGQLGMVELCSDVVG